MPKYQIEMTVDFSGEVEADSEEEAVKFFIEDRETMYYDSVVSESIEIIEDEEEDDA